MTSFIGDYICKVDNKGRLLFPAAFKKQNRSASPDRYVVKKDIFENCLVLYTMEEWERQNALIRRNTNPYNREHNKFLREFYRGTSELVLDSSGRMLFPKHMLETINADTELALTGQDSRIEIWAKDAYGAHITDGESFANLAEKILGSTPLSNE
ncbi:MAG: protein mraZ [Bacteroidales bacterium]|jgi:MraZ protein|nr:protein mraZ [Bacteroidales bacterium]MDD4383843.1 protein mraZ [Bacteroidales bacterium]MDY0196992.1 protein mraZ [Tenuifilaceae bacterium]